MLRGGRVLRSSPSPGAAWMSEVGRVQGMRGTDSVLLSPAHGTACFLFSLSPSLRVQSSASVTAEAS